MDVHGWPLRVAAGMPCPRTASLFRSQLALQLPPELIARVRLAGPAEG
jgi:hypothetical protein